MKCPYCGHHDDRVTDSRAIKDGAAIRRRRECLSCHGRFTSYETIEVAQLMVVKKDGRREEFDRMKIRTGIQKACEKRPISTDTIDSIVEEMESKLFKDKSEVSTRELGEELMARLFALDEVAYVRFASVYRKFKDLTEFMAEIKTLLSNNGTPDSPQNQKQQKKNSE